MKKISELKISFDLRPEEICSSVRYFKKQNLDWDVYLESQKMNLQRDLVWTLAQKRTLIESVLIGRHIPHCAIINAIDKTDDSKEIWHVIDGKQRLSTIFDFIDDKFSIILEGEEYLFSQLPDDYQRAILHHNIRYYVVNEPWEKRITDEQKIAWFTFINFAGTPQDEQHIAKLKKVKKYVIFNNLHFYLL